MSIVIKIELRKIVGFHGKPLFFVEVQFQSPPAIRDDNSDLCISQLLRSV